MAIVIREAELATDKELLLNILLRNREHGDNAIRRARFEWSFFRNPFGRPRAWLVFDQSSGRAVGMVAAFPRRLLVNGQSIIAWNGGDTSVDHDYRTLGVAMKLRRAVKDCVDREGIPFLYSFPVDRMCAVLQKVGHLDLGMFIRHGLILRSEALFARVGVNGRLSQLLSILTNGLPSLQWCHRFGQKRFSLRLQRDLHFGEEYDALFQHAGHQHRVVTVRDSQFLNWRFVTNPAVRELQIFRLEEGGQLAGYALIGVEGRAARIIDLLVAGDHLAVRTLLLGLIRNLRAAGIHTLALQALRHSAVVAEARPLGFMFPDTRNAIVSIYVPDNAMAEIVKDHRHWFMTQADRDV